MSRRTIALLLSIAALATLAFFAYMSGSPVINNQPPPIFECNADGKICPDGSVVGRTGPACEFAECPGTPTPNGGAERDRSATLRGYVVLSPTCPVEQIPPDPLCSPKGFVTNVYAISTMTGAVVAETQTTSSGEYALQVAPGTYVIRGDSGDPLPRCEDFELSVEAGEERTLNISCDTGIR